jgi:DNA processing protein
MTEPRTSADISDVGRQYLRLHLTTDIGPIRLRKLIEHFGSLDRVLGSSRAQLEQVEGIGKRIAESVFRARSDDSVDLEIEKASAAGVRIICAEDNDWPAPLRNIPDPPICLYVRGRLEPADAVAVAMVGTRRCSHYGREQAMRFGQALGGAGFTVVSGLARGIDGHAHRGALAAGGRTIAVLGNGLPPIYPREHVSLADEIAESGAIVSELPIDTPPDAQNFPRRNRIIAGLSLGVLVVEAGKRSGALITARLASEYNREAFAVPGRVDQPELTAGVNGLIRDGQAKLVTCLDDLLDELAEVGEIMRREAEARPPEQEGDTRPSRARAAPRLAPHEEAVLSAVTSGLEDAEQICETSKLDMACVTSTLTALQLKGLVKCLPGNRFVPRSASRYSRD